MATIPPVGTETPEQDPEHEILYMYRMGRHNEDIVEMEISFLSDHQVYYKVSVNGVVKRIQGAIWSDISRLYQAAAKRQSQWHCTWHPAYTPGMSEFSKSVRF